MALKRILCLNFGAGSEMAGLRLDWSVPDSGRRISGVHEVD